MPPPDPTWSAGRPPAGRRSSSTSTSNPASRTRQKKSKSSSPKNHSGSGSTPASTTASSTRVAPQQATSTGVNPVPEPGRRDHVDGVGAAPDEPAGRRPPPPRPGRGPVVEVARPGTAGRPGGAGQGEQADVVLAQIGPPGRRVRERLDQAGPEAAGRPGVRRQPDHADLGLEGRVVESAVTVDHHDHPVGAEPLDVEQRHRHVAGQAGSQVGQHHRGDPVGTAGPSPSTGPRPAPTVIVPSRR